MAHRSVPDCDHAEVVWSCRSCRARHARQDYAANKQRYKDAATRRTQDLRDKINLLKSVPCADCGQTFDPVCMDFDHLPGRPKFKAVSYMLRHRMSWELIEREISKCEVVCSNCHRLRTKMRGEEIDF